MSEIVIDIETIPDLEYGREHLNLDGLSDEDIIRAMTFRFLQQTGSEFPPLNMHKIITISLLMVSSEITAIKTFSIKEQTEEQILKSLHKELNKDASKLISWNGLIFDIPVIKIRSMLYELTSSELLLCSSKHLDLKNEISFGQTDKIHAEGTVSKQVG
jgi:Predicted 3''-5'' exonuclease related to the exonuclease domain of PolB